MNRPGVFYRLFRMGMDVWSHLLPVCASAVLIFLSFLNLIGPSSATEATNLRSFLHISEILVLALISPVLIMRPANMLALFLISYLSTKMLFASEPVHSSPAALLLLCSLGVLMTLGDRLPWLRQRHDHFFGERLRAVLLILISLVASGIVLVTMFKVGGFSRWFSSQIGIALAPQFLLLLLAVQLILWLMISMSLISPILLSLLALPSFAAALFVTGLTSTVLIIPFIICLALATTLPARQSLAQS